MKHSQAALRDWAAKAFGGYQYQIAIDLPGKPAPASRPRITRKGVVYYAKTYRNWRDEAARLIAEYDTPSEPLTGPLGIVTEVVYPLPKKPTRNYPQGDVDNYEKAAWDALGKGGVIRDDDQIVASATTKRYTDPGESPGVWIQVFPLWSSTTESQS